MNMLIRPKHPNIRLAHQGKMEEREIWHKLVVKIIIWKEGSVEDRVVQLIDKITPKEWNFYRKHIIETNVSNGREKALAKLKETWQKIKSNGGFAEK